MPVISCGECFQPIPVELWNREESARCPWCGQKVQVTVFPAIERSHAGALPEELRADEEASCFYHPQSRAAVPCESCGRFLCRLCDLEVDGHHLCPVCFQSGAPVLHAEVTRRTMYDTIALALAALPSLLIWPAVVTAPASLFLVFRWWAAPGSIVPRTKVRFVLAGLIAAAEVCGAAILIWLIVQSTGRRPSS